MWPWIKRWRDWAMHDLWPLYRIGPQPQALHFSYEKAGLTVDDQPIPWNAEAVLVEAMLRLPQTGNRRKADFQLRVPGQDSSPPSRCSSESRRSPPRSLPLDAAGRDRHRRAALPRQSSRPTDACRF